ncbi:GNAT family N-acetyltransferase [Pedobacter sp. KR3-3]|uniref:GNAT family N-acetyltransferase n=1 Tax=Pedobacter albus TaxID=3113905 RepID=A0ABU7I5X1_9SPHI|nr:GNAT family N-acetyltransferase [Pedobacter sp. KR3-3]MEE1944711.1 GNAT family N-acetyltransferase [Pedobacter sp. KR3-3]
MIRQATLADAKAIATLTVAAMPDLAMQFCASNHIDDAIRLLEHFIALEGNQYSYHNALVYVADGEIAGSISGYDGAQIKQLRQPFFAYLQENYHPNGFEMEYESELGEYYLDTISVSPLHQGKGIGKSLIKAALQHAKALGHSKAGLLVDEENPDARRLYEKLGFEAIGHKILLGKMHHHLSYRL